MAEDSEDNEDRQVSVIEASPAMKEYYIHYVLLTEKERREIKQLNPEYIVRLATQDELRKLKAEENPWEEYESD